MTFRRFVLRAKGALEFTRSLDRNFFGSADSQSATKQFLAGMPQIFAELVALLHRESLRKLGSSSSGSSWNSSSGVAVLVRSNIFGRTDFNPLDDIGLHSSDHRLCPSTCVPTRRTPIFVRESFHRSVNMFFRALSHDKSQEVSTLCQVPDGSLEGSSAPRVVDPEHAQV